MVFEYNVTSEDMDEPHSGLSESRSCGGALDGYRATSPSTTSTCSESRPEFNYSFGFSWRRLVRELYRCPVAQNCVALTVVGGYLPPRRRQVFVLPITWEPRSRRVWECCRLIPGNSVKLSVNFGGIW